MLSFQLEALDDDGKKNDLVISKDDKKIITIRDLKIVGLESIGTFISVLCALVGYHLFT